MNKIFTLIACCILTITAKGYTNYFQDGTSWEMMTSGTHAPSLYNYLTIELDGDTIINGMSALKMYETSAKEPRKLLSIIRTEGEKVYFQSYKESEDWTLLYDFGLKEGEGCYVGIIDTRWQIKQSPIITYVKCTAITTDEEHDGMEAMTMEEYEDSTCVSFLGKGVWYTGLGSSKGVIGNSYFDAVGYSSWLIKAVCPASGLSYPKETSSDGDIPFEEFTIEHTSVATNILNINTSENLTVYAIDGKILKHIPNPDNCETITFVNPGIYIIKNGNTLRKIIIR